ncbi:MAG: hypothetical protein ACTSQ4_11670, partial [Candidatus Heimdallarchaeaceae archaeon]
SSSEALIRQRMMFEALGNALKRASSMSTMFKVMFAVTLIFGLPTLILLSNPLKDGTTFGIQLLVYGTRVLLVALAFYLLARVTPELYTAKNDMKMKIEEIGYRQADANSNEEKNLLVRNILYSILKILIFIASGFGLFLISSRVNYGYIIGQQAIYFAVVVLLIATIRFWNSSKPDYSPRLGGRLLVLVFVPATYFWAFEIIINFFSVVTESNIRYNYTQSSFGFAYPFVFLFLVIAVKLTTRKTIREKTALQKARETEFKRVSTFIEEKGVFRKIKYKFDTWWNKVSQKLSSKSKQENLDKKPNLTLLSSVWIALFFSVIAVAFMVPWNIFPQDAMLFVSVLMISYQFSMIKYEREEIEVISEPERNEEITPPTIRTNELSKVSLRLILLPTIIFIITQYIMSGILSEGILNADNRMLILLFTWIAVLIVVPTSIQMIYLLAKDLKNNREFKNFKMYFTFFIYILVFELILLVITLVSYFVSFQINFQFIDTTALILQAIIVFVMVILPVVFMLITTKVNDKGYKILQICTWVLIGLISLIIIEEFLHFVIEGYFLVQWPW